MNPLLSSGLADFLREGGVGQMKHCLEEFGASHLSQNAIDIFAISTGYNYVVYILQVTNWAV